MKLFSLDFCLALNAVCVAFHALNFAVPFFLRSFRKEREHRYE